MADYTAALPDFPNKRDKTRPRDEWCEVSIYKRAVDAEEHWQKEVEAAGHTGKIVSFKRGQSIECAPFLEPIGLFNDQISAAFVFCAPINSFRSRTC